MKKCIFHKKCPFSFFGGKNVIFNAKINIFIKNKYFFRHTDQKKKNFHTKMAIFCPFSG